MRWRHGWEEMKKIGEIVQLGKLMLRSEEGWNQMSAFHSSLHYNETQNTQNRNGQNEITNVEYDAVIRPYLDTVK